MQRVLLARALYPNPKVLVLDEGTANLDAENEAKILEVLKQLNITRIAVAHRPATLEAAERVFGVVGGEAKIVEQAKAKKQTISQPGIMFSLQKQTTTRLTEAPDGDGLIKRGTHI